MKQLMELELTIFILILCGAFFKRKGIIGEVGQKNLTDLVIDLILPCNIIVSFTSRLSESALTDCVQMLLISSGIQVMAVRVPALGKAVIVIAAPHDPGPLRDPVFLDKAPAPLDHLGN